MRFLPRRIGLLVAATGALLCLVAVPAPVASAATTTAVVPAANVSALWPKWWCRPVHIGRGWRWDETRRGGHWDHREFNRRTHRWEWTHYWRDNRYCAPVRPDGPPRGDGRPAGHDAPPRGDGRPAGHDGPQRGDGGRPGGQDGPPRRP